MGDHFALESACREETAPLGIEFLEQPMQAGEVDAMRALPDAVKDRLAADETLLDASDALALATLPAPAASSTPRARSVAARYGRGYDRGYGRAAPAPRRRHDGPSGSRRHGAMKHTTHARLRRTAAEAVGTIAGIQAVVLYGSRARGTARATSDWDVAILSHAPPEGEQAATKLLGSLERVHPIVMRPDSIEAHCNRGTRLESAVARQGRLLAGEWRPPPCRIEDLDVDPDDLRLNLHTATCDLRSAFLALCEAVHKDDLRIRKVVEDSQQAAEMLAKTIIAGFGLSPVAAHDLNALATQLENAYRGRRRDAAERRRFAAAIRALDGNTEAAHGARYRKAPVETRERTVRRIADTLRLQAEWLRWYAGRNPEMRNAAVDVGGEIADAAGLVEGMRGFDRLDHRLRAGVRAWGEAGRSIAATVRAGAG